MLKTVELTDKKMRNTINASYETLESFNKPMRKFNDLCKSRMSSMIRRAETSKIVQQESQIDPYSILPVPTQTSSSFNSVSTSKGEKQARRIIIVKKQNRRVFGHMPPSKSDSVNVGSSKI